MVSVGDQISQKNSTSGFTWPKKVFPARFNTETLCNKEGRHESRSYFFKVDGKKKCYDEKIFKSPEINFPNYFKLEWRDPWTVKLVRILK